MDEYYFLENYLDIDISGKSGIKVTYEKPDYPQLQTLIIDKDIAIKGFKLTSRLFEKEWYVYKKCNVIDTIEYDTFIIFTIKGEYQTAIDDVHGKRNITIQELLSDAVDVKKE